MSRRTRNILLVVLVLFTFIVVILCVLLQRKPTGESQQVVPNIPTEENLDSTDYTIVNKDTELGDLTVYDVLLDGEPYKLVKVKGQEPKFISYDEYYSADVGDTENEE